MNDSEKIDFAVRIGNFFLLTGFILFLLFAWSDQVAQNAHVVSRAVRYKMLNKHVLTAPNFDYFFMSIISVGIGIYLRKKAPPPPPSERFSTARKLFKKKAKE